MFSVLTKMFMSRIDTFEFSFEVHPLRMTTSSSSTLNVGLAVAEEANA